MEVVFHEKSGELGIRKYVGFTDKEWKSNYAIYILDPVTLQMTGARKHINQPWRPLAKDDPRVLFIELFDIFEGGHADWEISHTEEGCEADEMGINNRAEVFKLFRERILEEPYMNLVKKLQTASKQLKVDGDSILDLEATVKKLEEDAKEPNKDALLLNLDYIDGFIQKLPNGLGEETLTWAIYAVQQYVEHDEIPGGPIDPDAKDGWNWEKFKASFKPAEYKPEDGSLLPP